MGDRALSWLIEFEYHNFVLQNMTTVYVAGISCSEYNASQALHNSQCYYLWGLCMPTYSLLYSQSASMGVLCHSLCRLENNGPVSLPDWNIMALYLFPTPHPQPIVLVYMAVVTTLQNGLDSESDGKEVEAWCHLIMVPVEHNHVHNFQCESPLHPTQAYRKRTPTMNHALCFFSVSNSLHSLLELLSFWKLAHFIPALNLISAAYIN